LAAAIAGRRLAAVLDNRIARRLSRPSRRRLLAAEWPAPPHTQSQGRRLYLRPGWQKHRHFPFARN